MSKYWIYNFCVFVAWSIQSYFSIVSLKDESIKYIAFDKLDSNRLPDVVEGLQREDVLVDIHQDGRVNKECRSKFQEHMADVTVGMLYLACKGIDLKILKPRMRYSVLFGKSTF